MAPCGKPCPCVLPYPCPGQVIHQEALTGRENQSHLRYLTASTRYCHGLVICEGAAKKRAVYLGREAVAFVTIHGPILSATTSYLAVPGEVRTIQVSRPDSLRFDAQQSDVDSGGLIFYGKAITQFEAIIRG